MIQLRDLPYAGNPSPLDQLLRYDVPGIAPLVFLGYPDGLEITAERHLEILRDGGMKPPLMIAELRPAGLPLSSVAPLGDGDALRVGRGVCDTVIAWLARREPTDGMTPETVYVAGPAGARRYAGTTTRVYVCDGKGSFEASFADARYLGPMSSALAVSAADAAFMVAQVIWFAATNQHAYGPGDGLFAMEADRRGPFTAHPELGGLLGRVLVFDEAKRIDVHALRGGLVELAQRWGVELPPFPPPGLAD